MQTVKLKYLPGDTCWVEGQYKECIIERVIIEEHNEVTYEWYNVDRGVDCTEVWDDGYFTNEDIGVKVFDTLDELEKAFPEDFDFPEML